MSANILEVEDLVIRERLTGRELISNLAFNIPKKSVFGLIGESGAGKSIVSLSVMGLLPENLYVASGRILFDGQDLTSLSQMKIRNLRATGISMVFQDAMTSLNPIRTIGLQIMEPMLKRLKLDFKQAEEKARYLLFKVGICPEKSFKKYPHEFSGGQQQRVLIAMALSCDPKLLIADEPTTALDVVMQDRIIQLFSSIKSEFETSILIVSHDLVVVSKIADSIGILRQGEMIENGSLDKVLYHPSQTYTKSLIACRPPRRFQPKRLATLSCYKSGRKIPVYNNNSKPVKERSQPILTVKNLSYVIEQKQLFRKPVKLFDLRDINIELFQGETLGIVGESGSGKTTLGKILAGLETNYTGDLIFRNKNVRFSNNFGEKIVRRHIQYVFQNSYSALNPNLKVYDLLMEPILLHDFSGSSEDQKRIILRTLDLVRLSQNMLYKFPHQLSGGQRQRVNIARILILNPEVVIFDESVSALDVSVQAQVLNLLLDIQDALKLSYIFISHDLSVVKFFADKVVVMDKGRIVEVNTADSIFQNPKTAVTRRHIEALPVDEIINPEIYSDVYDLV